MAIKINLESTKIPVEIGDLKFEIDVTDEKYETFIKNFNVFLEKMEALEEENLENLDIVKELLKDVYDELLGENAYEQVYKLMPNTAFVAKVIALVVQRLMTEMEAKSSFDEKSKLKVVKL